MRAGTSTNGPITPANASPESGKDLDELTTVTASGALQMTDDARISAIDRLYTVMQDKYGFLKVFSARITQVAAQREQGSKDAETLKNLYDKP